MQHRIEEQQRQIDRLYSYIKELMPWTNLIGERVLDLCEKYALQYEEEEGDSV